MSVLGQDSKPCFAPKGIQLRMVTAPSQQVEANYVFIDECDELCKAVLQNREHLKVLLLG